MMFKHAKQKLIANIGIGLISGLTAVSFAGVAIQMGYSGFKTRAEKQLHILNSIRFATIIQIGIDEGWVNTPDENSSSTIKLDDLDNDYQYSINLKNPSLKTQKYDLNSSITIENNAGQLHFYCNLIEDGSEHQYTNSSVIVYNLSINDINLNLN